MTTTSRAQLTPSTQFSVPRAVVREPLSADELVVLDTVTHRFYSLNSTGKRVYELAAEGRSLGAIAEEIAAEYDIEAAACLGDVQAALTDLEDKGLLVTKTVDPGAPAGE